ncbi:hypothetical protein VTO73DRAFT_6703 [Trametes versicolor]
MCTQHSAPHGHAYKTTERPATRTKYAQTRHGTNAPRFLPPMLTLREHKSLGRIHLKNMRSDSCAAQEQAACPPDNHGRGGVGAIVDSPRRAERGAWCCSPVALSPCRSEGSAVRIARRRPHREKSVGASHKAVRTPSPQQCALHSNVISTTRFSRDRCGSTATRTARNHDANRPVHTAGKATTPVTTRSDTARSQRGARSRKAGLG